jgi:hypothetical protein
MADKEKILFALSQLDPLDDDQWTTDGSAKVEIVSALVGEAVKRQDIVNAAPDFNREKASKGDDPEEQLKDNGPTVEEQAKVVDDEAQEDDEDTDFEPANREMSASEFMEWIRKVPRDQLENIEVSLKQQNDEIGAEIEKLRYLQKRISQAVSITRNRIKEMFPNSPNQNAIREFIESQAASRAERADRRNTILKGIRPDELDPRSPLDSAMARKTKRGAQRPVRTIMK